MTSAPRIVVLSGPVGAGKSTLGRRLAGSFGSTYVRTQDMMRDLAAVAGDELPPERRAMQEYGEHLDAETAGQWVADGVGLMLARDEIAGELIIVDAVRRTEQIEHLRDVFPARVTHIHVHAPLDVLAGRYEARRGTSGLDELSTYEEVAANATEAGVRTLAAEADVSIDTQRCSELDVQTRAVAALRLSSRRSEELVDVLVGGQYGSEGKGNIAYYLAPEYGVLMRVGGPNAGHTVPTSPVFTHRLLPSGTLANPDAKLVIGPGTTIDLDVILPEIAQCQVEVGRLFIDPQAMIIEEADKLLEQALVKSIGSTGKGGGAAAARRINGRHGSESDVRLARDVQELWPYLRPSSEVLEEAFNSGQRVLLEGTQGTALSLFHGHYPHVTSRDTTTSACLAEAGIGPHRLRRVVMVARTYPIRVGSPPDGTSGWMSQEIDWSDIAERSGLDEATLRANEKGSVSGSKRRVSEFDWTLLKRAAELNGATDIALTFADYFHSDNEAARRYEQLTPETIHFIEEIERVAGAPVSLIGTRFDRRSVIDRREW